MGWQQDIFPLLIVVGSEGGVFIYDNSGNLVDSVADLGNVDPLTKSNQPGIVSYLPGSVSTYGQLSNAELVLHLPASVLAAAVAATTAGRLALDPGATGAGDIRPLVFIDSKNSVAGPNAPQVVIGVPPNTPATSALVEIHGAIAAARLDVAPAATAPPALPAGVEPWNAMAPLQNAWANSGGTDEPARYRLIASPPNSVEIGGVITHAAIAGSSQFFTLPAAYTPTGTGRVACNLVTATAGWAPNATWPPRIAIDTVGNLTAIDLPAGTTKISFHGIFPLD